MVATTWNCQKINTVVTVIFFVTFLYPGTAVDDGSPLIKYQCVFYGGAISCYTSSNDFACCYEPAAYQPYLCGAYCVGEVSYQPPVNSTVQPPAPTTVGSTVESKETTPWHEREKTTLWYEKESSKGVKTSALLLIVIPISLVFLAIVGVSITWCVARFKDDNASTSAGAWRAFDYRPHARSSEHDVENALNESRREAELNRPPPQYHTTASEQVPLADNLPTDAPDTPVDDSANREMSAPPPSYETATRQL